MATAGLEWIFTRLHQLEGILLFKGESEGRAAVNVTVKGDYCNIQIFCWFRGLNRNRGLLIFVIFSYFFYPVIESIIPKILSFVNQSWQSTKSQQENKRYSKNIQTLLRRLLMIWWGTFKISQGIPLQKSHHLCACDQNHDPELQEEHWSSLPRLERQCYLYLVSQLV